MNITYCDICLRPKSYEDTKAYVALGGSPWGIDAANGFVICLECVAKLRATAEVRERSIRAATGGGANV